jgi:hypothetical protein
MPSSPDERTLNADIEAAPFQIGVNKSQWDVAEAAVIPEGLTWPYRIFWVAAANRPSAPARFYLRLDCQGYPVSAPTGSFWDPERKDLLAPNKWPKGNERVSAVFRPDWNSAVFYHPYDRVAASGHDQWKTQHPHLIWDSKHTIVEYLSEMHDLLNCADYLGI